MKKQSAVTTEERRCQLNNLLGDAQHGSTLEQRIDVEMRLLLARYNDLQRERARTLERACAEEQHIRAKLECAGELLGVEPIVIAASLSTIALHYVEHAESSFEHGYPLLEGYMLGENPLPFPRLDFFTKEEISQLLDLDPEQQTTL